MATAIKPGTPKDVDAYIAAQPEGIQPFLEQIRALIKKTAPDAEEVISYQMPGYRYHGMLVWFGAQSKHCGLYAPGLRAIAATEPDMENYKQTKGSIHFPYDKKPPAALIKRIVKKSMIANISRARLKQKTKN